jgi:23S rRNA pseudouridine2605 synthase
VNRSRGKRRGSPAREKSRQVGLARALSKLGYCSRSQAAELVRGGRVQLNGKAQHDPEAPVSLGPDRISVDGQSIGAAQKIYWILNKPRGVVTTASDEKGRETVYAHLPEELPWLAPVGRLDKASEGLLLLTNDPEWAARITSPETHLDKTYHVQIAAIADPQLVATVRKGVLVDGQLLRVKRADILREGERNSWLVIVLDEGKNRQIRRIFDALRIEVLRLVRVAVGPLGLGDLPKGKSRALTSQEKRALGDAMGSKAKIRAGQ